MESLVSLGCLSCGRQLGYIERRGNVVRYMSPPEVPSSAPVKSRAGVGLCCSRCGGKAVVEWTEELPQYSAYLHSVEEL
jgi:hypothetical protein